MDFDGPSSTISLARHQDTFLTLKETSVERRFDMPFRPTYPYDGSYLSHAHGALIARLHETGMLDVGIDGWLLPAAALKLYEHAFCCGGDILELGAYRGLSASIMSSAIVDSGRRSTIVSIDLDEDAIALSTRQLKGMPGGDDVYFFRDDAASAVRNLAGIKRQFAFAFVDHSHAYDHVLPACQLLHRVVELGGFALFHDFNDPRNSNEATLDYGVYQGVLDGLRVDRWEFWGIYGCSGLFRRIGPC